MTTLTTSPPPLKKLNRGNVHKSLPPNRMNLVNYGSSGWFVADLDNTVTLEDVLTPVFWSAYSNLGKIKAGARINAVRKDLTLDVDLRVLLVEPGMVKVRLIQGPYVDDMHLASGGSGPSKDETTSIELPEGYKAAWWENLGGWMCNDPGGNSITKGIKGLSRAQVHQMAVNHHKEATTPNLPRQQQAS